jgi:hypothetical protein
VLVHQVRVTLEVTADLEKVAEHGQVLAVVALLPWVFNQLTVRMLLVGLVGLVLLLSLLGV